MERKEQKEVVKDVATKKKYVKPDFEVYELNWEAPLLSASGPANADGRASFSNNGVFGTSSWGSNN